ncbi:DUF4157 domain-containing protein [Streptomyces hygroscopicus]|uniref:eCIS core domain-containing protein n=1 Tax=Streptomyces hygroscopicus TaxID=1912 RepID=UPI00340670E6
MSNAPATTQDDRASAQSAKRRKRKERVGKARTPEPKDIVNGAGHPLDPSVRRDLEEQLGHDLGQVRLHTDRDAGRLTELLGADAVAVGQDIFFREHTYRPGTTEGQRLLAHELLHTIQNPHGLGTLRAGRDLGAVSLPQDAIEREAESTAQELASGRTTTPEPTAEVQKGQATPGWLRYATVDADRLRAERVDPETLVDRLANSVLRSLRGDPADASGRVRLRLARMSPDLQDQVLDRLEIRMPTPDHDRLVALLDDVEQGPLPVEASVAPHAVPDAIEGVEQEREREASLRRAVHENAERSDTDRRTRAQREKAQGSHAGSGAAPKRSDAADAPTGQAPGTAREQTEQRQQEPPEPQSLQVESDSDSTSQGAGDSLGKGGGSTTEGQGDKDSRSEPQPSQSSAKPQRPEDKRGESSTRKSGAVRPGPVDKSAAERDEDRAVANVEPDAKTDQDPDDEPLGLEETGEAEALAALEDIEGLLTEDEEEVEPQPEEPLATSDLDASTPEVTSRATGDQARGEGGRPPRPRPTADDVEAIASALEESADEEADREDDEEESDKDLQTDRPVDQEVGPDPDRPGDGAISSPNPGEKEAHPQDPDGPTPDDQEAEDRDLASETRRAQEQSAADESGGEDTGPGEGTAPGQLAKAGEDARGQTNGTSSGGGGSTGGASGTGDTPTRSTAASATAAASPGPGTAGGGDTGVTAPAAEVRSAAPKADAPPRHEPARPDDDKPVTAKAAPRGTGAGRSTAGGGGGGAAAKSKKAAPAPDVSNATPEAGLAAAANLKPHLALTTLKGVDRAVGRTVAQERGDLKASPPTMERPVGSPMTVRGGPKAAAPGTYTSQQVGRTQAAQGKTPEIKGEKAPNGELPGAEMEEPGWWDITIAIGGALARKLLSKLLPIDKLTDSINDLPSTDKELQGAKVGDAPKLPLKDDSDPERTDKQARLLDDRSAELHTSGRDDAGRPMGEDQIYPDVPKETLTAKVRGGKRQGGGEGGPAGTPGGGLPVEAVSAVAEHEQGPQIQHAFGQARQKMTTARRTKETQARQDRRQYERDVRREIDANTKEQATARARGRIEIAQSRVNWRKEQDDKLTEIDGKKSKHFTKVRKDIKEKQDKTDGDVDQRTKDDQKKIDNQRTGAEKEVTQKRDEGKKDSGNWFEKGLNWIKEQFNKLKKAIKDVFEKARNLVKGVIEDFKKQVFKLIDDARKWVIQQINDFADMLIRLGDELLKDYPAMQAKWRKTINGMRDAAIKKVNQAADKLKNIAGKLIDSFGGLLLAGLDLMEKGLLLAVDLAETVTVKAMEKGAALLKSLGEWKAIATDILSDPGGWLGKAKDAAVTGAKKYLFAEITAAVKEWFNQKIQQLIGIPMEMFQRLIKGGTSKEEMAKMAWDAALPQLPLIIGELIVTKVVAKLIPGAGWVMAVIDALKTAYDALSSILRAVGLFMNFLKAVKSGAAARPFARAVASGVVALLELIYQWLVSGVGKYLGKVARVLRGRAKKLGKKGSGPGKKSEEKPDSEKAPKTGDPKNDPKQSPPPKRNRPEEEPTPGRKPEKKPIKKADKQDDEDRRRDGRYVNAARRTLTKAARNLKSPTRPGRRDDPKRPGTRRPDEPGSDDRHPNTRRPDDKRTQDRRPDLRKPAKDRKRPDKKDSPKQRPKQGKRPQSRVRRAVNRARQTVKSALTRVRRAARALMSKARNLRNKLQNLAKQLRKKWQRMKNRLRRDSHEERRGESMRNLELPKVRYRADSGELHTVMFHGRGRGADIHVHSSPERVLSFLADWKREVAKLEESPDKSAQLVAIRQAEASYKRAKPLQDKLPRKVHRDLHHNRARERDQILWQDTYEALTVELTALAHALKERPNPVAKPTPYIPSFPTPTSPAKGFTAKYLNKSCKGTPAPAPKHEWPIGWKFIQDNDLNDDPSDRWVQMHLLPDAIGGPAKGKNLVPASGPAVNIPFLHGIEQHAKDALHLPHLQREEMIWYDVQVDYHAPPVPDGFPSRIKSSWGGYKEDRLNRVWEPDDETTEKTFSKNPDPPDKGRVLYLNLDDPGKIRRMLGEGSDAFVNVLVEARDVHPFRQGVDIMRAVRRHEMSKTVGGKLQNKVQRMRVILDGIKEGRISLKEERD